MTTNDDCSVRQLMDGVEEEATLRNHEVVARVLHTIKEEGVREYLNNPGVDIEDIEDID